MNEWYEEKKKIVVEVFQYYGKIIIFATTSICIVIAVWNLVSTLSPEKLRVSFLDVGQGDAIFIQTPSGQEMLIDGGPTHTVIEGLSEEMSYFDRTIDIILATHPDADHVTGLIPVLEKFEVSTVMLSPSEGETSLYDDVRRQVDEEEVTLHIAHTGDEIDFGDGVLVRVLYPSEKYNATSDTNDASVAVVLSYGVYTFLLTGDLGSDREGSLITNGLTKNITVYKAGHHGSDTSSGEQLLSYIKPEYSVISAGKDNKYGHPSPEALLRLQKHSKEVLSTIDNGTITFMTDGRTLELEKER